MSRPAARLLIQLGAGFSEKYHVSLLLILGHCFDVVSLGKVRSTKMLHLTQVKMSTWKDRDGNVFQCVEMAAERYAFRGVKLRWHTIEQVQ